MLSPQTLQLSLETPLQFLLLLLQLLPVCNTESWNTTKGNASVGFSRSCASYQRSKRIIVLWSLDVNLFWWSSYRNRMSTIISCNKEPTLASLPISRMHDDKIMCLFVAMRLITIDLSDLFEKSRGLWCSIFGRSVLGRVGSLRPPVPCGFILYNTWCAVSGAWLTALSPPCGSISVTLYPTYPLHPWFWRAPGTVPSPSQWHSHSEMQTHAAVNTSGLYQ